MNKIIGRENEIKQLEQYLVSGKAEFVVVYGRRRVGKTFLIREFFNNKFAFYFSGAENKSKQGQLNNFTKALRLFSNKKYPKVKTWDDAFFQLREYSSSIKTKRRKVIFIDEMPWLDTQRSGFLSAFEYFWNTFASADSNIFLVACGSATSWMLDKLLKNRGGLHNRVTRQIALKPFTLKETEKFLLRKKISYDHLQIAECYMIMGGIPYYLEQIIKENSLYQNVDNLFFKKDAILNNEFSVLYSSLFKKSDNYVKIIKALDRKKKGLTREEIIEITQFSDGGSLTKMLDELEQCDFIRVYNHFGKKNKNKIYQLIDFYSLFYLNFIQNAKNAGDNYWSSLIDNQRHKIWSGFAFERLCFSHINQIKRKLGISGVLTCIYSWHSSNPKNNVQIDLVIDRNDRIINLCEIKFSNKIFAINKEINVALREQKAVFLEETGANKAIHTTMITSFGVKHNSYWNNIQSEITLDDLFEN
ncbi:MAG: ATP-binding protein [Candidatus Symbiothrix sp.]|jgi:AAA+ ATPase superfamily predicted ATPase|nr:ATP-binding protein [Candidatus Symbiothrix sp.]